jgi:small-conductance mechanosensitive channel
LFVPNKFFIDTNFINLSHSNGVKTLKLELVITNISKIKKIKKITEEIEKKLKIISEEQEKIYQDVIKEDIFLERVKKFYEIKYFFDAENSKIIISLLIEDKSKDKIEKELIDLYLEELQK